GLSAASISTVTKAGNVLSVLDAAIQDVSERRATLGAVQNRLQITMSNLETYRTNLAAANSRIVDVDVASETADMTRNSILVQAGAAMLAQANQAPQVALNLLR
ncbi:MAG: flagellin FliC, partial [Deltaproteobacteria bacterium]